MAIGGQSTPRFGQDRIAGIPPLNLLDALYAQGVPQDYLRQMMGMTTPQITSFLLRNNQDRWVIDRAVRMAQGEEQQQLGNATSDYEKLYAALANRGVDMQAYTGKDDVNALASWAQTHTTPQVFGNAAATALPNMPLLGGRSIADEDRRGVQLFSNPQPSPTTGQTTPTTTRGIPTEGDRGARGQGVNRIVEPTPGGTPTISGQTPGPGGAAGAGQVNAGLGLASNVKPLTPDQLRAQVQNRYGWAAAFVDIPEVQNLVNQFANGQISEDELVRRYRSTDFYKTTTQAERDWQQKTKTDPADAARQLEDNVNRVTTMAASTGAVIDPGRIRQIAENDLKFNWSDQMVNQAIASEIHYDPSGAKTGILANLKAAQRNSLVPLSDQAMTQWAQSIVGGTKTTEDFNAYLKDQAKSLFPALAGALDNDPKLTVRHYLDPYGQTAAKTLGINPDDIDWTDGKWNRFINQVDPKTGQRTVMNLADTQRTLMADDQYGFDQTTNGKAQKSGLARTILQQWGFMPNQQAQGGF